MTTEQMLVVAIVTLASAVTFLFKLQHDNHKECKEDRKALIKRVEHLENLLLHASCKVSKCPSRLGITKEELQKQGDLFHA